MNFYVFLAVASFQVAEVDTKFSSDNCLSGLYTLSLQEAEFCVDAVIKRNSTQETEYSNSVNVTIEELRGKSTPN